MESYPAFEEIKKEDLLLFEEAFKNDSPRISEFTFTNLYAWKEAYRLKASLLDDLIILCSESGPSLRFFNPIGKTDKKKAIEKILNESGGFFIRIPEETKDLFGGDERFKIDLDIDNSDYLYRVEDLTSLRGRKYDGKRNLINKFQSDYVYEYIKVDAANVGECLKFEESWCAIKDCDSVEGLNNERAAIRKMIENFSDFKVFAGAIKIKNNISAVACAQRLNPDTMVVHVLKADPNVNGLYQTMLHEFISKEAQSFTYVNLEQDLGQEGLRKSKQSYHPIEMINKYTLRQAE